MNLQGYKPKNRGGVNRVFPLFLCVLFSHVYIRESIQNSNKSMINVLKIFFKDGNLMSDWHTFIHV